MALKLTMIYQPVADLDRAVTFYRDTLGWDEAWRMGDTTAAFKIPDSEIELMLDIPTDDPHGQSGFYEVADVDAYFAEKKDSVDFLTEPVDLPPIRYAAFKDPDGNVFRIYHSTEEAPEA
ncbi:VOC family protein [Occultella kanbiaonis]|uniref:VOC family protein n=1 Tax=Occultella kanbiaonis TaxID=2675754 RepID=UPI0012B87BD0|nr:VOC family protein [Occultella kanbiaonis]